MFNPFEKTNEIEELKKNRDSLLAYLQTSNISEDERRFIIRKINILSNKLLKEMNYTGKNYAE